MNETKLDITNKELHVYEELLKTGATTISNLSSKCSMNQRSVYDYIERLIFKGLVGEIWHNNKRQFLALNPEIISHNIEEEKKFIESEFDELEIIAKKSSNEIKLNMISSKQSFLKLVKGLNGSGEVYIGENCDQIITSSQFIFFSNNCNIKIHNISSKKSLKSTFKTTANALILFVEDYFIAFSLDEDKGFFIRHEDFAHNMKVYFS
jgi:hypothetical protein